MMKSKLRAGFERLGRVQAVARVPSGSPVVLVLRRRNDRNTVETITATHALAKRGMSMLRAKRAVEAALDHGEAVVEVPTVESLPTLASELASTGLEVMRIAAEPLDVKALREDLGMSQELFARRYGFELDTLQNWEQGARPVKGAALHYLRAIKADPVGTARAQEETIQESGGV
jgi:DNA-binding transcriptional regulator YiaG